ncbi:hypothetical protein [Echinicola sp. 20G]|uniref:hypothetical protein n=1 Tax=Echinicola sp. 20G TaxID=2781961 RepID=UPI0019101F57|nr:hypothetical protein [Echinicola sp. 20G]
MKHHQIKKDMPEWISLSPGFWWGTAGFFLVYYSVVLSLLFGPVYLAKRKRTKLQVSPPDLPTEELWSYYLSLETDLKK